MSYQERIQSFTLEIGGETYPLIYTTWSIDHTLNTKIFTFAQFTEAYVSKQDANGFSITFTTIIQGDNYDIDAIKLRKSLQSKEKIYLILPLGSRIKIPTHLISLSENWDQVEQINCVKFSIKLHTTTDSNLPNTLTNTIEKIQNLSENTKDVTKKRINESFLKQPLAYRATILNDIKNANDKIHGLMSSVYAYNNELLSKASDLNNFINQITSVSSDLNLLSDAFNTTLDLINRYSDKIQDDIAFFTSLTDVIQDDTTHTTAEGYEFSATSILRANASNNSKLSTNLDSDTIITKSDMLKENARIYDLYSNYIETINNNNASSIATSELGLYVTDQAMYNSLKDLISTSLLSIESISLNAKQENTTIYNMDKDYYVIVNELYEITSVEELENKVNEIIKINNFQGEKIYGLPKGTELKYLV